MKAWTTLQVSVEVLMPFGTYNLCNEINDTDCGYTCAPLPGTKNPIRGVGVQPVCGGDYSHFLQCPWWWWVVGAVSVVVQCPRW